MAEDRKYKSVSLSVDLIESVDVAIEQKKAEVGEALLPPEYKSSSAFIAESTRLRLQQLKKSKVS
jgi:hypothetical protein